jgi:hypothetical protein
MCSKRSCPCCWCPDSRLDVTDKMASTDKLQMYWHKWTLRGTSCWTTMRMCCGGMEIVIMPPTAFHLPPETHGRTVVQGPSHAPMVRTTSKSHWYGIPQHLPTAACPLLDLWTSGILQTPVAAENDIGWALKDIPGIS